VADYATTGVTVSDHALAILRPRLPGASTSADLQRLEHGARVTVAGMVVARQRPATAHGMVFLLLEDERGTINLVLPPPVYERHRRLARAEPLLVARGRLERPSAGGGTTNVVVSELRAPPAPAAEPSPATVVELPDRSQEPSEGAEELERLGASLRAVAPAVQSFASGRRR
jgi:error-prone DNA polymerase